MTLSPFIRVAARLLTGLTVATALSASASAETLLRIGDQKGNARAVLEAANALAGVSYKIQWVEFPAAAPLLEAAKAGAIDAGTVSAILSATVAAVSATPSVDAAPEIRVGSGGGIGMAVAEALKIQPIAIALQNELQRLG